MTVGIVEELASFQFGVEVKMTQLALQGEEGAEFTSWRITATDPAQRFKLSPPQDKVAEGNDSINMDASVSGAQYSGVRYALSNGTVSSPST